MPQPQDAPSASALFQSENRADVRATREMEKAFAAYVDDVDQAAARIEDRAERDTGFNVVGAFNVGEGRAFDVTGLQPSAAALRAAFADALAPVYSRAAARALVSGVAAGEALKALPPVPDRFDALAVDYAISHGAELVVAVTQTMRETIADAVTSGIQDNLSMPQLAARIRQTGIGPIPSHARALRKDAQSIAKMERDGASKAEIARAKKQLERRRARLIQYRTRMIARTEVRMAQQEARFVEHRDLAARGELPKNMRRVWIARDPCPICAALAARAPVGLREPFKVQVNGKAYSFVRPPAHPHCRCVVGLVPPVGFKSGFRAF